jgi:phenylacetate-CoA ligase
MQALTDRERYPLITPEAFRFLQALRQHPHAPAWNHRCGDRLTADGLARVREFERRVTAERAVWPHGVPPDWVYGYARQCLEQVPQYRDLAAVVTTPEEFLFIPPTSRETLATTPWQLVPDDAPLDDLIVYDTSGRTGQPIVVPTHPVVSSMYLVLLRAALATRGIALDGGPGRVAIVNVCRQRTTFAFASVSSFLDWAGFAKVNLNPAEWRDPDDCVRFLDACDPEIYTGDPLSFATLAGLPIATRPKALVSTSMAMPADVRRHVEARLGCPVVDLYSLTESAPVAVDAGCDYRLLRPDLYVEILDNDGRPCPPGARGEIVLTGGQNPFFPLLRYRTGDRAAMVWSDGEPRLVDLEGRQAMLFRDSAGGVLNNVDVAAALAALRLPPFHLHQYADGRLSFRARGVADIERDVRAALAPIFGPDATIELGELLAADEPSAPYTSDIELTPDLVRDRL